MNPLVKVEALPAPGGCAPEALPASFFAGCRAVVLAGAPAAVAARVCDTCRAAGGVAFFAVDVGAAHGIFFEDLGTHTYVPTVRCCSTIRQITPQLTCTLHSRCAQVPKKADDDKPAPPAAPRTLQYCTLQVRTASAAQMHLRSLLHVLLTPFPALAAIRAGGAGRAA